ncbi:hypothetical protein ASC64_11125 [Nocardioides sp. Root122]|uniref:hypothetical protein n=1 Tax=Nocardioides TaxID=1839 RepID=UPI0007033072|nr:MULTISPECIES: hypothetical protein [Nocardioides]KQV67762.1 hypothetical protein ASC64_11125 [Nocardioides sp. Root122]MCK9823640.1 hypothetical protein [Nocardioides cavernae]
MSEGIKDRHLLGAGAAACAVCCAPPLLAGLGLAGAGLAATLATLALAGLAFGAVVLAASVVAVWARRRAAARAWAPREVDHGPVDVAIGARPADVPAERGARG